jgi:hypothetical protein
MTRLLLHTSQHEFLSLNGLFIMSVKAIEVHHEKRADTSLNTAAHIEKEQTA